MNEQDIKKEFEKIWEKIKELEINSSLKKEAEENSDSNSVFEVEDEKIIVTKYIGDKTVDKTQNITLLTLLGYKQKFKVIKVSSSLIKENVATHGIALENFGTHLKKLIPQSILRIGKVGNSKVEYKLTTFGEARAKNLLKEVVKNE